MLPYAHRNLESMNAIIQSIIFSFEKFPTDINDSNIEIIGGAKIEITYAIKEGTKNDLIANNACLLKGFKAEVINVCSCIGSSLMAEAEKLLKRE